MLQCAEEHFVMPPPRLYDYNENPKSQCDKFKEFCFDSSKVDFIGKTSIEKICPETCGMVAYIIKIEDLPTFSDIKTDKLIGFCVVDLLRNHLQMLNLSYF